jgi:hypothetical protein
MGDYELTGLKNKGLTAVDFDHGCGLLSQEDQEKMELILAGHAASKLFDYTSCRCQGQGDGP